MVIFLMAYSREVQQHSFLIPHDLVHSSYDMLAVHVDKVEFTCAFAINDVIPLMVEMRARVMSNTKINICNFIFASSSNIFPDNTPRSRRNGRAELDSDIQVAVREVRVHERVAHACCQP